MDHRRSSNQELRSKTGVRSIREVVKQAIDKSSTGSELADLLISDNLKMVSGAMGGKTIFRHYSLNKGRILTILLILVTTSLFHLLHNGSGVFSPFVLAGLLDRDEIDTDNWVTLCRVSTPEQEGDGSLTIQGEKVHGERKKSGGKVVYSTSGSESATSADRDTLEKTVTLAQEGRVDVVGAYKIDRITRAIPMESMRFFVDLYEAGVTIYIGKHGYLDWNDLSDFQLITNKVEAARRRVEETTESADESYILGLEQGKCRYGGIHFGYTIDDELNILVTSLGAKVIPRIFEVYIDIENRSKTVDIINDEFDLSGDDKLSSSQVRKVLESRKCIGELCHKGQLINTKSELRLVTDEQFHQAQKILEERQNTPAQNEIWPDWMSELAKRCNLDVLISEIDNLQSRCGKCDGELIRYGTDAIRETTVPKIKCKDCEYQGPIITRDEFDRLHSTAPVRCPDCIAVGGAGSGFECKEIEGGKWDYEVTCSLCGSSFGTNSAPEPYEEAVDQPRLKFTREAQDIKGLLKDILEVKNRAASMGSAALSEQDDIPESEKSDYRSLFSFS
jgi:site-specific DNA recombinase